MDKRELKSYRELEIEISCLENEIRTLDYQIGGFRAQVLSDLPRTTSKSDWTDDIDRLMDLKNYCRGKKNEAIIKRIEIKRAIDSLESPMHRALLNYRYIQNLEWRVIGKIFGYERTQMNVHHNKALEELKRTDTSEHSNALQCS